MEYQNIFKEKNIKESSLYTRDEIGVARLFHDLHFKTVRYVVESKTWYFYNGKRWLKDDSGLKTMELCKTFVQAYDSYAKSSGKENDDYSAFTGKLKSRRKRESILNDAKSIAPLSLSVFDVNKFLFNCTNGTFNLKTFALQQHKPDDYITKISRVSYDYKAKCPRWEQFISEIMCGDESTAAFLQKALGYALTGDTALECFFILYGNKTRNGKTTLSETVAYIFGDYARTIQPQTLGRRPNDGAAASPDIARLKGARLVNMPEPEKGLELNISLVKQLTGGDTFTGRFLNENPFEFRPECKFFINTNHLPRTSDDTVFASNRLKLIPFERHFSPEEQDNGLKKLFRVNENRSGILNWMITGYKLFLELGLDVPERVANAIAAYRQEADIIGTFLSETTIEQEKHRLPTSKLYAHYIEWAKDNGYRNMNSKNFVSELRRRLDIRRDGAVGNVIVGLALINTIDELPY